MKSLYIKKIENYFIGLSIILLSIVLGCCSSKVEADDPSPGGVFVSLLPDPAPKIIIDTSDLYTKDYVPIKLWGVVDNSATSWAHMASIPQAGMSFIADVSFNVKNGNATGDELSAQSLKDSIDDAYNKDKDAFGMTLAKFPDRTVSIDNTKGFSVVNDPQDPTGQKKVLQITLRGDQESGLTSLVIDYYKAKYDLKHVEDTINFAANKQFILSKNGEDSDESPGKVNTKGLEIPSASNYLEGTVNFYNYDKCYGASALQPWRWSEIYLKSGATPSLTFSANVPTWSEYLSPWDSKGDYNTTTASFNEVNGVTTELPGGYLTPTIDWNLKKDGPPTEELIAQRFGRVVNYFNKTVDNKAKVTAVKKTNDDGADFTLSSALGSNDVGILQRSISLKTKYKAVPPSITPHEFSDSYARTQEIPFTFDSLSPTSQWVQLYEAIDSGDFKAVGNPIDEHDKDPQKAATENINLPPIDMAGRHSLYFKLKDSNGLESEVKTIPINIDQRALVTKDTEIRRYNQWDPKSNIVSVKDRDGQTVDPNQVTETGNVNTMIMGTYPVTYNYDGLTMNNTVTVNQSLRQLSTKDITLTVGDTLDPKDGFIFAKDNDGHDVPFDQVKVTGADKIDTRKSGDYSLTYSLGDIAPLVNKITVHVMKGAFYVSTSSKIDFPKLKLDGQEHILTPDEKPEVLSVTDLRGINSAGWELHAKYQERSSNWTENHLDLLANFNKKDAEDSALDIPEEEFEFNQDEKVVCSVSTSNMNKERQQSDLVMAPKLKVPAKVTSGTDEAKILWNLIEEPEK